MKSVFILATLLSVSCLSQEQNLPELKETSIKAYPGYELIWNEEFETDGRPNDQEWTYEYGFQRNRELQWYQEENAFCEDGKLIIEGRKELKPNPHYKEGNGNWKEKRKYISYTSACLTSKQSWQYGRFEIKAKIKAEQGLWPAIWFLGKEGQWPSKGEIDLMEYYQGQILANACWGTKKQWKAKWDSSKTPMSFFKDLQWDQKFHVWRMDWDEEKIELYVDDILLNTIELNKAVNATEQWGLKHPFKQKHYLLLNLAIGGTNGGDPINTQFPSRYEIDYVRVYQKKYGD